MDDLFPMSFDSETRKPVRVGLDEAGRGCLFGPVSVGLAANIYDVAIEGVKDSKAIKSEARRAALAGQIQKQMLWVNCMVSASWVDQHGIEQMLRLSQRSLIENMIKTWDAIRPATPAHFQLIVDGNGSGYNQGDVEIGIHRLTTTFMVKADAKVFECSAASIIAKHTRDAYVTDLAARNPVLKPYVIPGCKGYGTEGHIQAIALQTYRRDHWDQAQQPQLFERELQ